MVFLRFARDAGLRDRALAASGAIVLLAAVVAVSLRSTDEASLGVRFGARAPGGATEVSGAASAPGSAEAKAATRARARTRARVGGALAPGRSAAGVEASSKTFPPGKVLIGYSVTKGPEAVAEQFGLEGVSTAGGQSEAQAIVDYVNAHGGLGGRKIVPIYQAFDITRGTYASEAQAACSAWTEDHKVFAAIVATGDLDNYTLPACMAKHRTPLLKSAAILYDRTYAAPYRGYFYQPGTMWGNRWGVIVDGLHRRGFFGKQPTIGLIRFDSPEHERTANDVVKPRLAAHRFTVAEEVTVSPPEATSEVGRLESQMASAVLRFKTANVTHVLFVERAPTLPLLFMTNAESQDYRPWYGLPTVSAPILSDNVPEAQLRRVRGIGWAPTADVALDKAPPPTANKQLCMEILKDAGHTYTDGLALGSALAYCDQTLFLKTAIERALAFTPPAILAAVDALDTTFVSATTFATRFAPGRYDGVAMVRPYQYDDACSCFSYVGAAIPAP